VSSHGVGVNVSVDLDWFERIVACGLPEKRATSLEAEGVRGLEVGNVAGVLAEMMAIGLEGVFGVACMAEREVESLREGHGEGLEEMGVERLN